MPRKTILFLFLLVMMFLIAGCGAKKAAVKKTEPQKEPPASIAVLPVINQVADPEIGRILRQRLIDELYFKGYPRISAGDIDARLAGIYGSRDFSGEGVSPAVAGEVTGAEAVLYCKLEEMRTSYRFMYAPTQVTVFLELRSAQTGETIWKAQHGVTKRNFGFTRRELERKSFQDYEAAIGKILEKVMKTFPEGPGAVG